MTRRPKTPRTPRQTALLVASNIFGAPIGGGFRRQPKGRRAKSGQWFRRYPRPVLWGSAVGRCLEATIAAAARSERARQPASTLEKARMEFAVYGMTTVRVSR